MSLPVHVSLHASLPVHVSLAVHVSQDLDYEAMDEEHRGLLQTIREASSDTQKEPAESISLRAQVPTSCGE